jgi:hypothetical protein
MAGNSDFNVFVTQMTRSVVQIVRNKMETLNDGKRWGDAEETGEQILTL